jgi:hypothetical protein
VSARDHHSDYRAPAWYVAVDVDGERFYIGSYVDGEAARMVALEGGRMLRDLGGVVCAVRRSVLQLRGERVVAPLYALDALNVAAGVSVRSCFRSSPYRALAERLAVGS